VPQAFVEATVANFSAHKTPLAHVVIENYHNSGEDLAPEAFPDPAAMVKTIGAVPAVVGGGCKVVLWLDPHVHRNGTTLGDALVAGNCTSASWQDSGGCGCHMHAGCGQSAVWLPRCMAIWRAHVDREFIKIGIGGFKLDQDDGDGDVGFADNVTFPSGMTGGEVHNVYGFAFQKMFHEMYTASGVRTWMQVGALGPPPGRAAALIGPVLIGISLRACN
jgi:alpha-glucosidase (family GH31 glycosyl hydrolase)